MKYNKQVNKDKWEKLGPDPGGKERIKEETNLLMLAAWDSPMDGMWRFRCLLPLISNFLSHSGKNYTMTFLNKILLSNVF